DMAAELLEYEDVQTTTVRVTDDVVSAAIERKDDRRGIAGDVFVIKVAGAAAEKGLSLEEVTAVTQKANDQTFSIGVALSPGTIPDSGEPRSEEHTSELQSRFDLVCRLLLEKKRYAASYV